MNSYNLNYLDNKPPKLPNWEFYWLLIFILIIGCLFIIWVKDGMI